MATAETHVEGQQHPLGIYIKIWAWLFFLSACSYAVDYFHVESYLRWSLILLFMFLKAGLIIAVFMHMMWERMALMLAIAMPPLLLLVFIGIMAFESDNTFGLRKTFFSVLTGG
ncbi:MAG: cytochrome c oxidase subunit 4 [Alphaproteobacteria bacterium]|jgi:cytochrome c oxidase subunit 4